MERDGRMLIIVPIGLWMLGGLLYSLLSWIEEKFHNKVFFKFFFLRLTPHIIFQLPFEIFLFTNFLPQPAQSAITNYCSRGHLNSRQLFLTVTEGRKYKSKAWHWRHGSVVRNACCSRRRPVLDSQHPHCGSLLPITPVPGDPTGTSMVHVHVNLPNT